MQCVVSCILLFAQQFICLVFLYKTLLRRRRSILNVMKMLSRSHFCIQFTTFREKQTMAKITPVVKIFSAPLICSLILYKWVCALHSDTSCVTIQLNETSLRYYQQRANVSGLRQSPTIKLLSSSDAQKGTEIIVQILDPQI